MELRNITPKSLLCTWGACPAVYQLEDGTLAIIGDSADPEITTKLKDKIAPHEVVALIKPEFLADIIKQQKQESH